MKYKEAAKVVDEVKKRDSIPSKGQADLDKTLLCKKKGSSKFVYAWKLGHD